MSEKAAAVDFKLSSVIIGNGIDAIRTALERKVYILRNRDPHMHSYEPSSTTDSSLEEEWASLSYELFNLGLDPFTNRIKTVRVDSDNKTIRVLTSEESAYNLHYDDLFVFDLANVYGLESYFSVTKERYRVVDWFDARGISTLTQKIINTGDNFVRIIKFFNSCRVDGDHPYQDLLCESFLTEDQLKNPEYTDTMARFKTISILKSMGFDQVNLKLWRRDVYPVTSILCRELESVSWAGDHMRTM